jgi:uroporphyrinogen III methyltransferase/synthase
MKHPEPQVSLVGAGPGDPGLLTLRAVECLQQADLILHDRLVPERLLDHARRDAVHLCVDQLPGEHAQRWPHIHRTLIEAARQGKRVVRLKGGDPLLFGRGGEEAEALRAAGITYDVVPGVTAALGAAGCAGIPLTHREHASAVAFITGHQRPDTPGTLDWEALARFPGTLVFYMCIRRLGEIVATLLHHGKAPDTPAAAVYRATTPVQRTLVTSLSDLPARIEQEGLQPPALVIIGSVVSLRSTLAWFEDRPLFGRRVIVTRPRHQAGDMVRQLELLGAAVSLLPTVQIAELEDWQALDATLAHLSTFHWVVFTSSNGVHAFLRRLRQVGLDLRALGSLHLAAIGPATADALRAYHLEPDLIPEVYRSEELAEALRQRVRGQRVLLARADRGREYLLEQLAPLCEVQQVAVYHQRDGREGNREILEQIARGEVDYITLTSSNIARALVRRLDEPGLAHLRGGRVGLVSISPVTSQAIRELGLPIAGEASTYTTEGVLRVLCELAEKSRSPSAM